MILSFNCDEALVEELKKCAERDGHTSCSAVIRKAVAFFLNSQSQKVTRRNARATAEVAK